MTVSKIVVTGPSKSDIGSTISYKLEISSLDGYSKDDVTVKWFKGDKEVEQYPGEDPFELVLYDIDIPAEGMYWALVYFKDKPSPIKSTAITLIIDRERRYVHDLNPGRDAGFIQVGYWVVDEINKANEDGFDWRTDPTNDRFKYKTELYSLSESLKEFPIIETQESRNGYIIKYR